MNKIITLTLIAIALTSCTQYSGNVPEVGEFSQTYDLYLTSNQDLCTIYGSIIDTTIGYRGVLVFRNAYEGLPDDFLAFDMACSHDPFEHGATVTWERWGVIVECPVCGTKYLLINYGWPIENSGPSVYPLRQYKTFFDGRYVTVSN
ncbi:MAG: hypothetical protein PHU62_01860 [Bacteroidales bacterium]|nr:hypothetical protein [Bacteroidales bacterium]MDD3151977.1 hypothetical protein [Bacteroidales bacterium]MDD3913280.1 hypothetical protein [Bacteroidales bacterium]MDD4633311.1 hypothetical protein [Bacteroidales bacterium]